MFNVLSFFRNQIGAWRRDNDTEHAQYIRGGVDALREVGAKLSARKDVIDADKISGQLSESERLARRLSRENTAFQDHVRRLNEQVSNLQGQLKNTQGQVQLLLSKSAVSPEGAQAKAEPSSVRELRQKLLEANSEAGSLRTRIKSLETNLRQLGLPTADNHGVEAGLRNEVLQLRTKLDALTDTHRVGVHRVSVALLVKRIRRVLSKSGNAEVALQYVAFILHNADQVMQGQVPDDLPEALLPKPEAQHDQ
jgi:predicted nuclease with TOPRIM domain